MSDTILGQSAILNNEFSSRQHYQPDLLHDGTFFSEHPPQQRDLDFEAFKRQQRDFIEAKLQLQTKIESL